MNFFLKKIIPDINLSKKISKSQFSTYEFVDMNDWCNYTANINQLLKKKKNMDKSFQRHRLNCINQIITLTNNR